MKKVIEYLKALPSKAVNVYKKTKRFIASQIPQELRDELNRVGGVTVFAEFVTLIVTCIVFYIALCALCALV